VRLKVTALYVLFLAILFLTFDSEAREPVKPQSDIPEAQELIDKAWTALDQRMHVENIDEAIKYLEKARGLDPYPNNHEILVELADEYYQRGQQMPRETEQDWQARNNYFKKGYEYAQKAKEIKESAGSHFWMATNLGASRENASILSQVAMFPELESHMDWIRKHNPDYKYGAVARFYSAGAVVIPNIVLKIVGHDKKHIFQDLEKAIETEPRFIDNYIYKAIFYYHEGKKEEALDALDKALEMDPEALPSERAYNYYAQENARKLRQEWTGKKYPEK
jgi:tetratricopeptide (TPR) repeat protein